jgi:Protein of unknown function (DUF3048) N-terminal domain/Protein of unknown function (DUF3048) C-terminal domain
MIDDIKPPTKVRRLPEKPKITYRQPVKKPVDKMKNGTLPTAPSTFVPPQYIESEEPVILPVDDQKEPTNPSPESANPKKRLSKKKKSILLVLSLAIIAGAVFVGWKLTRKDPLPSPAPVEAIKEEPKPTTVASKLSGLQVDPALNLLPVTGVMIENSPDARPQSGLVDAAFVFEAIAEGGITRFLALYQDTRPDYVGPVRSARPYYLDFALPFEAGYAHVGGSPDAISQISQLRVRDLDQFYNAAAYQRVSSRYAPHNVYTSIQQLLDLQKAKGYTTSNFTSLTRKEAKAVNPATHTKINLSISGPLYNVHYDYDTATNSYKRTMANRPHVDEKSGKQISPRAVVALVMTYGYASDGLHSTYQTTGSGKAYIFQNGTAKEGAWKKPTRGAQLSLVDETGKPIALVPGQTWVTLVGEASDVSAGL